MCRQYCCSGVAVFVPEFHEGDTPWRGVTQSSYLYWTPKKPSSNGAAGLLFFRQPTTETHHLAEKFLIYRHAEGFLLQNINRGLYWGPYCRALFVTLNLVMHVFRQFMTS